MLNPGLKQEYQFRRERLNLSDANAYTSLGPLRMSVARDLTQRRLYCGVVWRQTQTFAALMSARARITLWDGSAQVFSMGQNWGFQLGNSTSSSWGNSDGPLGTTSGWPDSCVEWFDFKSYIAGTETRGGANAIKINGCGTDPNGTIAYSMTMFPYDFVGNIDEMRFEFIQTSIIYDPDSFVEVYIGCNSSQS